MSLKHFGSFSTLRYLSLFGLAVTVPLLLLFGALLFQSASSQRTQLEGRVLQVLDALVNDVDREFDRDITILHTLSTSEALAHADWPTFYRQAKAGLQGRAYLVLVDSSGRQLVNTYVPYGSQPAMTGDPETLHRILQTKAPAVSNLFTSLVVKKPVFNVSIPILQDNEVRYVMSLGLVSDDLVALLRSQKLGPEWVTLIWDANGVLLARSRDNARYVGKPLPQNMREQIRPAVVRTANLDGTDVLHATAHPVISGWGVGVNIPYSMVTEQMRKSLWLWGAAGVVAITIALLLGVFFARQITTPLAVASSAAAAFGQGASFSLSSSHLQETDAFLNTLKNAQQAREKLTEELRQSRDWLKTALASIGDGVIATDAEGKILLLNAVAQSLTGWTQEEAAGKPLQEVFVIRNAETGLEVENPASKVLREGRIVGLANHTRLIAKDGRKIPIDDSGAPIRDGGRMAGVVLVFRDISERLKAEERMRVAVEAAPNAMIMVSRDGRIELINSQTEKLFGYSRGELLGELVEILVPERYRAGHGALRAGFLREPVTRPMGAGRDLFGRRKDGTEIPIEIGLNPISTSQGDFVLAGITDISERKRAEERLRRSEAEFRQLADSMPQIVWTARPDGYIDYYNRRWYEFTGFPEGEFGQSSWEPILHPDDVKRCIETYFGCVRAGQPYQIEYRFKDRITGGYRWFMGRALPIRDESGAITRWFGTCTDVHDLKRAEEDLRRANEDLNQFAFAASHDLQEPLRMIATYSQLLLKSYRGQLDDRAKICVDAITQGTRRMRELLADLLAYTQLSGDRQETVSAVNLNEAFGTAVENCKAMIQETGGSVTSEDLPVVPGRKSHFVQLFQNLISNGLKYRSAQIPRIHVAVVRQEGMWRIAVKDNGMGIAPEYHKQIFGVFKRLHGSDISGTGIGLAICQRVVERYGGRIWVESRENQGATFYFTLPAAHKEGVAIA